MKRRSLVEICPFGGKCCLLTTRRHKPQETFLYSRHYGSLTSRYMASLQTNLIHQFKVFTALLLKTAFFVGAKLCRCNCATRCVIHHSALIFRAERPNVIIGRPSLVPQRHRLVYSKFLPGQRNQEINFQNILL